MDVQVSHGSLPCSSSYSSPDNKLAQRPTCPYFAPTRTGGRQAQRCEQLINTSGGTSYKRHAAHNQQGDETEQVLRAAL